MKIIKKFLNLIEIVLENIGMLFLLLMTIIITGQVICRYFFNFTPKWSEEVSLLLMVWFGFIGLAIGVRKGLHLSIEFFISVLPKKGKLIILKIDDVLVALFGLFLAVYGKDLVKVTLSSTLPATQWPAAVIYIMVPVSGFMIMLYSFANLVGLKDTSMKS